MSDAPRPIPEILAELQAAADEVTAQRLHFGYIADTIRVNALRNGATTEQVEDFIHGRASFVNWMAELVEARGKTENAALQSRVAELEAANRGLVRLNEATEARAEAAEAARRMIVSHATGGETTGEGMSVNDISVRITAFRNVLWEEAKGIGAEAAEAALAAMTKELEAARLATGLVRMCVNCGATRPADYGMVTPRAGCPSPDACTWDMTPQEAVAHWRKIAHDRYAALAAERAKVEKLVEAGKDALIILDEFHIGPESPVIADLRAAIEAASGQ